MKLTFRSRYSPGKNVNAAQYLAELVCYHNALRNNKDLPLKFWELEEWHKYFIYQIKCANDLLKVADAEIVIKYVNEKKIWNLGAKWILDAVEKLQRIHISKARRQAEEKLTVHEREYIEHSSGLSNRGVDLSYLD